MNIAVKEWLYNLNVLYNHIDNALFAHMNLYQRVDRVKEKELLYDTDAVFTTYILVYTNSYMDEWKIFTNEESIKVREVCKPIFKYIDQNWSGIKKLRNNMLAHNHRNKENKSIHFNDEWLKYKVPMDNVEVELLIYLLGLTIEAVNKHYKFDFESVSKELVFHRQTYSPMNEVEASQIKKDILKEMNDIIIVMNISKN